MKFTEAVFFLLGYVPVEWLNETQRELKAKENEIKVLHLALAEEKKKLELEKNRMQPRATSLFNIIDLMQGIKDPGKATGNPLTYEHKIHFYHNANGFRVWRCEDCGGDVLGLAINTEIQEALIIILETVRGVDGVFQITPTGCDLKLKKDSAKDPVILSQIADLVIGKVKSYMGIEA